MAVNKSSVAKRELSHTVSDKRYVRRDEKGRFEEVDIVDRSLSQDVNKKAKTAVRGKGAPAGSVDPMYKAWGKVYANRGKK
jgi:hypothetical protein